MKKIIILSAPSGAGKTTICRHLLQQNLHLEFSISAASRQKRDGETDGRDYYFIPVEEFKRKIAKNEFLEWEEVYKDQFYGTLKSEVERIWKNGNLAIFDVDVKGGINIKKLYGQDALSIFIMPPSLEELEKRLVSRKSDSTESISRRIAKAREEMSFAPQFDRIVINDVLEIAKKEVTEIISQFIN